MATTQESPKVTRVGDKLAGRTALVTGGTRGIGAAICRALAAQGANIAAGYSRDAEAAERLTTDLSEANVETSTHQGNIGVPDDCRRTIKEVLDRHGRLDILVNNAGITSDKTVFKMSDEDWQKVLDVNLSGAFFLSKAALEHMVERGTGRIINISSIIGQTGNIGQSNYAASKSGLFGLTMTFAKEAAFALNKADKLQDNDVAITVNAIAPGFIETDMTAAMSEKAREAVFAAIPLGRVGRPEDVAGAALFLVSDAAAYVTGQVLAVDGGFHM
jgi:NAD(P)-dependent dehydrogenase (short-subunit alcohol dehydrogenase family)